MNEAEHYRRLERMYLAARINEIYQPRIEISEGGARIESKYIAEATVRDGDGNEVGRGNGIFVRSKIRLEDAAGYAG